MDLMLNISDTLFLDALWARLVPLSAFSDSLQLDFKNGTSLALPIIAGSSSQWSRLVSHLPHPPLQPEDMAASLYSSVDPASPLLSAWPRTYIPRQILSLTILTYVGIHLVYFIFAWLSYRFIFNHDMMRHPKFLPNQVRREITASLWAFPGMTLLTLPWFQAEVMGYSKLYDGLDTYGWPYLIASAPLFMLFTDFCTYWIHRWLHIPVIYRAIHKPHHKYMVPTPFASHAFHFLDGYLQSVPFHLAVFVFPLHRVVYLTLFEFVNFWTIFIHDSDMITGHALEKIINGPAHHTLHHLYFNVNYGQYFTWVDRVSNSYRQPEKHLDPLLEVKMKGLAPVDEKPVKVVSGKPKAE